MTSEVRFALKRMGPKPLFIIVPKTLLSVVALPATNHADSSNLTDNCIPYPWPTLSAMTTIPLPSAYLHGNGNVDVTQSFSPIVPWRHNRKLVPLTEVLA